jgi:hypothetical protein
MIGLNHCTYTDSVIHIRAELNASGKSQQEELRSFTV